MNDMLILMPGLMRLVKSNCGRICLPDLTDIIISITNSY